MAAKKTEAEWTKGWGTDPANHPPAIKIRTADIQATKGWGEDPAGHPVPVKGEAMRRRKAPTPEQRAAVEKLLELTSPGDLWSPGRQGPMTRPSMAPHTTEHNEPPSGWPVST